MPDVDSVVRLWLRIFIMALSNQKHLQLTYTHTAQTAANKTHRSITTKDTTDYKLPVCLIVCLPAQSHKQTPGLMDDSAPLALVLYLSIILLNTYWLPLMVHSVLPAFSARLPYMAFVGVASRVWAVSGTCVKKNTVPETFPDPAENSGSTH